MHSNHLTAEEASFDLLAHTGAFSDPSAPTSESRMRVRRRGERTERWKAKLHAERALRWRASKRHSAAH